MSARHGPLRAGVVALAVGLLATPALGATDRVDLDDLGPAGSRGALADDALEYPRRHDFVVDLGNALEHPRRGGFVADVEPGRPVDIARPAVERITGEGELIVADDGEELTFGADVFFAFDEAALTSVARDTLDELAGDIQRRADAAGAMQVVGHSDSVGDTGYNEALSELRAQAVADYLVDELGLGDVDLRVEGRGEADPVAPNETEDGEDNPDGRARNRRVELTFDA